MQLDRIASAPQRLVGQAAMAALTALHGFPPEVQAASVASLFVILHRQSRLSVSDLMQVADNKVAGGIGEKDHGLRGAALSIQQSIVNK